MSAATLSGREAPSEKRLDVEANLLEEWLAERGKTRRQVLSRVFGLALMLAFFVWAVARINGYRSAISDRREALALRSQAVEKDYARLASANRGIGQREVDAVVESAEANADAYMGSVISLMNSAPGTVAFSSLAANVTEGEITITGRADARNFRDAHNFVQVNTDPSRGIETVQLSTVPSAVFAPGGIGFEFSKKARVGR